MNWIKITPETELPPKYIQCLVLIDASIPHIAIYINQSWIDIDNDKTIKDPTHYCIITKPEK